MTILLIVGIVVVVVTFLLFVIGARVLGEIYDAANEILD